jgi:hypothetical protein
MASEIVGIKRRGKASVTKGAGYRLTQKETYEFIVVTDSKETTYSEVLYGTPGLPVPGVFFATTGLVCESVSCERREEHALYWDVVAEFTSDPETQDGQEDGDPTSWKPIIKFDSFSVRERVLITDYTPASAGNVNFGAPGPYRIRNSAKQFFETPLTQKIPLCSAQFVQFESASQDINTILSRHMIVNSTSFLGRAARTCLLEITEAEYGFFNNYQACRVGYKLTYDIGTWDTEVDDIGSSYLFEYTPGSFRLEPYMDETNTYRIMGNLNGSGGKSGNNGKDLPAILKFRTYREQDFSTFIRT